MHQSCILFVLEYISSQQISEMMTREMNIPTLDAKKACDTFLRRFRRCPENPRMPLDEWRLLLWIEALGEDYDDVAGMDYLTFYSTLEVYVLGALHFHAHFKIFR